MKYFALLTAIAALLTGCTFSKEIYGPDGKPMHSIQCPGAAQSVAACFEKASQLCGASGYDVLGRNESSTPTGFASASGGTMIASGGAAVTRNLMVRCREPMK